MIFAVFADIAGFTAWSSVREPAQVFALLEALYGAFDALAHHRGVFKVRKEISKRVGGKRESKSHSSLFQN